MVCWILTASDPSLHPCRGYEWAECKHELADRLGVDDRLWRGTPGGRSKDPPSLFPDDVADPLVVRGRNSAQPAGLLPGDARTGIPLIYDYPVI